MPKANWGVKSAAIDDFDRDSQYKPYTGPIPPAAGAIYQFRIKVAKFIAGTREKNPQLRLGLELIPREGYDEEQYEGYWIMAFIPVTDKTEFRYVPFLDAIGVSGRDFTQRTMTDEEGNIKRIGQWRNDGEQLVLAQINDKVDQNGNPGREVGLIMEAEEGYLEDAAAYDEDDGYGDDEDDEDE